VPLFPPSQGGGGGEACGGHGQHGTHNNICEGCDGRGSLSNCTRKYLATQACAKSENHPQSWFWDLDKPESGILLALVIITGEKNQEKETQSHAGAGGPRRTLAAGRRQTPAGAIHTGRQGTCGYGGPLRATDM
jgi:hypothetical protein